MATIKPESWAFGMRPFGSVIKRVNTDSQSNCSSNCCFYSLSSLTETLRAVFTATALLLEKHTSKQNLTKGDLTHVTLKARSKLLRLCLLMSLVCLDYLYSWCRIKPRRDSASTEYTETCCAKVI